MKYSLSRTWNRPSVRSRVRLSEGRINRAAVVNLVNAAMCAATLALVVWFRL